MTPRDVTGKKMRLLTFWKYKERAFVPFHNFGLFEKILLYFMTFSVLF